MGRPGVFTFQFISHWVWSDSNCSAAQLKDIDQVRAGRQMSDETPGRKVLPRGVGAWVARGCELLPH
jgi:hypothetical protein